MKKLLSFFLSLSFVAIIVPNAHASIRIEPTDDVVQYVEDLEIMECFDERNRSNVRSQARGKKAHAWSSPVTLEEAACAVLRNSGLSRSEVINGTKRVRSSFSVHSVRRDLRPYVKFADMRGILPEGVEPGERLTRAEALEMILLTYGIPVPRIIDDRDRTYLFSDLERDSLEESLVLVGVNRDIIDPINATTSGANRLQKRGEFVQMLFRASFGAHAEEFFQDIGQGINLGSVSLIELFLEPINGIPKLDILQQVWDISTNNHLYTDRFDKETAIYDAINGLLKGFDDPYTEFLPPAESDILGDSLSNTVEGIGAFIAKQDDQLTIVSPIKTSPAEKAGLQGGDVIVGIDGVDPEPLTITEAVGLITGTPGTQVRLTIVRDEEEPFDVVITRARVDVPTVEWEWKPGNIVYLNLYNFGDNTVQRFQEFYEETLTRRPSGIILDLRNNPGGLLTTAENLVGYFVESGKTAVNIEYGNVKLESVSYGTGDLRNYPLVVLINKGSASASEILAGAIQDHNVGMIVGETSFGKGTVQEILPFLDGSSLRMTVARWLTPSGHSIDKNGITPDIVVSNDPDTDVDEQYERALKELQF